MTSLAYQQPSLSTTPIFGPIDRFHQSGKKSSKVEKRIPLSDKVEVETEFEMKGSAEKRGSVKKRKDRDTESEMNQMGNIDGEHGRKKKKKKKHRESLSSFVGGNEILDGFAERMANGYKNPSIKCEVENEPIGSDHFSYESEDEAQKKTTIISISSGEVLTDNISNGSQKRASSKVNQKEAAVGEKQSNKDENDSIPTFQIIVPPSIHREATTPAPKLSQPSLNKKPMIKKKNCFTESFAAAKQRNMVPKSAYVVGEEPIPIAEERQSPKTAML